MPSLEWLDVLGSSPIRLFMLAGFVHIAVAAANLVAFRKFRYLEHLRSVPTVVRQVFIVQNAYLVLVQLAMAGLCFAFAEELMSGRPLPAALSAFLAVFWGSRVVLQLVYYDRQLRRENRGFDVLFTLADSYLTAIYAFAAIRPFV